MNRKGAAVDRLTLPCGEDSCAIHGFRGDVNWIPPRMTKYCAHEARPGYTSELAHEYLDEPEVLEQKVQLLATMIKSSSNCLVYTGAGLSTAAGIGDYASRDSLGKSIVRSMLNSPYLAQPTYSHYALAEMCAAGWVKEWIQQNHDGLPQKAGVPQHRMNEIHGAWYDPSNPVVPMSGDLRGDLFARMLEWEQKADLTLSMGTSMCGMNSDRVFVTVAHKAKKRYLAARVAASGGQSAGTPLGGVIISIQRTQYDTLAALRIFATIDEVMLLLNKHLQLRLPLAQPTEKKPEVSDMAVKTATAAPAEADISNGKQIVLPPRRCMKVPRAAVVQDHVFAVPYDRHGRRLPPPADANADADAGAGSGGGVVPALPQVAAGGGTVPVPGNGSSKDRGTERVMGTSGAPGPALLHWNLSAGAKLRLVSGPYAGDVGEVDGLDREGHYNIRFMHPLKPKPTGKGKVSSEEQQKAGKLQPMMRKLGWWWVEAAVAGTVDELPVVNC